MENQGEGFFVIIALIVYALVFIVPIANVLRRVGFSGWWSILAMVPLLGVIGLWIFAYIRWPIDKPTG